MRNADTIRAVKRAIRDKYAFPGGYRLHIVMSDGEVMCCDCARAEFGRIGRATRDGLHDGWRAAGVDIHWEGFELYCCQCGDVIEPEYGLVEEPASW